MNISEATQPDSDHETRVRFPADQLSQHDSEIVVVSETEDRVAVHLGFMQIHHHYELRFTIKDNLNEDLVFDPLQNLHTKVLEVMPSEDGEGHELLVDFAAYKEKILREELVLTDSVDKSRQITLVLHARVLGKGKGTPSMRTGIRCVGIDADDESEGSDWQGFD